MSLLSSLSKGSCCHLDNSCLSATCIQSKICRASCCHTILMQPQSPNHASVSEYRYFFYMQMHTAHGGQEEAQNRQEPASSNETAAADPPFHLLMTHLLPPQARYVAFVVHNFCIPAFAVAFADVLLFASTAVLAAAMATALQCSASAMIGQSPSDRQRETNSCMPYRVSAILLLTSSQTLGPFLVMSYDCAGSFSKGGSAARR